MPNPTQEREINLPYTIIAAEGGRGGGKTTVLRAIVPKLLEMGLVVAVNRGDYETEAGHVEIINEDKRESPVHSIALDVHEEWRACFYEKDGELVVADPKLAHDLAVQKFHLGISQLVREKPHFQSAIRDSDLVLLDRDLDTVVVYAAAELILSCPYRYTTESSRNQLLKHLWESALRVRDPAELVIYFQTQVPEEALRRGWESKQGASVGYELDLIQETVQDMVQDLYRLHFGQRGIITNLWQDARSTNRCQVVNIDGKTPDEVARIVMGIVLNNPLEMHSDVTLLKLPLADHPGTVEELARLIQAYSVGAAFPSQSEVRDYGASNCVYNNAAFVDYARHFELEGTFSMAEATEMRRTGTNRVHYCSIQFSPDGSKCRIIDTEPFRPAYIGAWTEYTREGNVIQLQDDDMYNRVTLDDSRTIFDYMEFAHLIQFTGYRDWLPDRYNELYAAADNETKLIFLVVRYARACYKTEKGQLGFMILTSHFTRFPRNLVLAREIARLYVNGVIDRGMLESYDHIPRLKDAWRLVQNMEDEASLEYYDAIRQAIEE